MVFGTVSPPMPPTPDKSDAKAEMVPACCACPAWDLYPHAAVSYPHASSAALFRAYSSSSRASIAVFSCTASADPSLNTTP